MSKETILRTMLVFLPIILGIDSTTTRETEATTAASHDSIPRPEKRADISTEVPEEFLEDMLENMTGFFPKDQVKTQG